MPTDHMEPILCLLPPVIKQEGCPQGELTKTKATSSLKFKQGDYSLTSLQMNKVFSVCDLFTNHIFNIAKMRQVQPQAYNAKRTSVVVAGH